LSEAASSVGGDAATGPPLPGPDPGAASETESEAVHLLRAVLTASFNLDPFALQADLDRAVTLMGLARCVDEVLIPARRRLRRLLADGHHNAAQDLMATEAIRTWLNHRSSFAPKPLEVGPVLLACGPRDRDVIGLETLAMLLRFQQWPCRVMGARVPTFILTVAAQAADAVGVVIISTNKSGLPQAVCSLRAVDILGTPVFFGGPTFDPPAVRSGLPGRYIGPDAGMACAVVIDALLPALTQPGPTAGRHSATR